MSTPPTPSDAARAADRPPRRHSFLWICAGMATGLVLALVLYSLYGGKLTPVPAAPPAAGAGEAGPDELLALQRAQNKGLEEEIERLRAALGKDPCALPGIIGESPDKTPLAPGYNPPGGKAEPDKPLPPSSNATGRNMPPAGGDSVPAAPAPNTVGELMDRATVFVISSLDERVGMGSGFFVAPGVIATNRHVAQGQGAVIYVGNKSLGGMHEARIIAFSEDESRDYALLRVTPDLASRAPILRIADTVSRMDRVSAWGFPGYITEIDPKLTALIRGDGKSVPEVVYSPGEINVILERMPPVILHSASLSQGNSGGPLVNATGGVVGINTFIRTADKSNAQANIALPGKDLALFMRENGIAASMAVQ